MTIHQRVFVWIQTMKKGYILFTAWSKECSHLSLHRQHPRYLKQWAQPNHFFYCFFSFLLVLLVFLHCCQLHNAILLNKKSIHHRLEEARGLINHAVQYWNMILCTFSNIPRKLIPVFFIWRYNSINQWIMEKMKTITITM